jgi:hypothetical protein
VASTVIVRAEAVHRAVIQFQAMTPRQAPSSVHDQIEREIFDEELGVVRSDC